MLDRKTQVIKSKSKERTHRRKILSLWKRERGIKMYQLVEQCQSSYCDHTEGYWLRKTFSTTEELEAYIAQHEPGFCPACNEQFEYKIKKVVEE